MIATEKFIPACGIDVGRPDIHNDEDRRYWMAFNTLVETWPGRITVNTAYYQIREILLTGGGYSGGGMQYMFWFTAEADAARFREAMKSL